LSFFAELRRRNVIRMAGVYLVSAWMIIQVAETLLPAFDIPGWVLRAIVLVLALGFLPALAFSWVFEMTPGGLKRESEIAPDQSIALHTGKRLNRLFIAMLVLAVLYLGLDKFVFAPVRDATRFAGSLVSNPAPAQEPGDAQASIAVLPFVDMSQDKDQEYFSDGLSEELLNQLAQIPQLRVIARTSSFSFKGKEVDVATIAKTLDVANVLEGSVRKSGNTLRITAQLIRASDSSHLWSKNYDRELADIFKVQDEIAAEVVGALKVRLLPGQTMTQLARTSNLEAHTHYLRGRQLINQGSLDSSRAAIVEFQRAIDLDPAYTSAWSNLAAAQALAADLTADAALQAQALVAIDKAIELSPDDAEAHAIRGWLRTIFVRDWGGAQADFKEALRIDGNNPDTLWRYSWLLAARNHLPEAIEYVTRANELDPVANDSAAFLGFYLNAVGSYRQAREVVQRKIAVSNRDERALMVLGESFVLDGKPADALAAVSGAGTGVRLTVTVLAEHALGHERESARALDELEKTFGLGFAYQIAEAHAWRGDKDKAFQWLERGYEQRDGGMAMIRYDPFLKSLRDDPRYSAMVRKLGLPE
jgi:adenylate cyclase